jgi:peptidoglycan/LPS O-acetylase OafA/YrhL
VKTEEPPPQPLVRRFMPELDVLRGIAVLGVLFFHGFRAEYGELPFAGAPRIFILACQPGVLGVNLFFVLSGFLITGILLDSRNRPDYYGRFYARRALRILPAYYLLLILLGLLHQASSAFLGLSFVYLANVTSIFGVSMDYHPLWSLAVEEHYYIAWPAILRKVRLSLLAFFLLGLCILIPVARAVSFHYGYFQGQEWYTWFTADGLAEGSLLAVVMRGSITRQRAAIGANLLLAIAIISLIVGAPFGMLSRQTMLGASLQLTLVNTFFTGLLVLFLVLGTGTWKGLVNSSILKFFGYISYGLYLIHLMIFHGYDMLARMFWPRLQPSIGRFDLIVLRFAVGSVVAVGLAYISRRYYEEWFLQLKDRVASQFEKVPMQKPAESVMKVEVTKPAASVTPREASESF